jgi:hypothetical protein
MSLDSVKGTIEYRLQINQLDYLERQRKLAEEKRNNPEFREMIARENLKRVLDLE